MVAVDLRRRSPTTTADAETLPGAAGALHRAGGAPRPRAGRLLGRRRRRLRTSTTRSTTARRWPAGCAAPSPTRPSGPLTLPPAARPRARPRAPLHAVQRRAEQLLGRLRRGRAAQGVPQDHARASTPTSRSTRCSPGAGTDHVADLYGWIECPTRRRAASRSTWRCSSSSCAPPPTAGSWPWPACATCSPRGTCTPTRWAATSPASPHRLGEARGRGPRAAGRALRRTERTASDHGARSPAP